MREGHQFKRVETLFTQSLWNIKTISLPRIYTERTYPLPAVLPRKKGRLSWKSFLYTVLVMVLTDAATLSGLWIVEHGSTVKQFIAQYQSAPVTLGVSSPGGTQILGIQSDGTTPYPGVPWLRLSYPTCGNSNLSGHVLKNDIVRYHHQGVRILLLVCQPDLSKILSPAYLKDAAQGGADAIQCGNEQMKNDPPYTRFVPPALYAHFFALCERFVHTVQPAIPVLMGSLDPRIVGPDNVFLTQQVNYLNDMQLEMNTAVAPGSNWTWTHERIGLNDSWHNGYPSSSTNNLYQLFVFWAQQFRTDLYGLRNHLWVVEGTACFGKCVPGNTTRTNAISHILTMITDVLTATAYHVPFFYFTGRDFIDGDLYYPNGVLDQYGYPKPLRQDIYSTPIALSMHCLSGETRVQQQERFLVLLYAGCTLPSNYESILES